MSCDCAKYLPVELSRKAVSKRIKESKLLRKRLVQVAECDGLRLMRCPECGQAWQSGREWSFANEEYFFQVPTVDHSTWQLEPFAQPAALMIYSAVMSNYWANSKFEPGSEACRTSGCKERAIRSSALCATHHVESLQNMSMLPKRPGGKLFPPYSVEGPDGAA